MPIDRPTPGGRPLRPRLSGCAPNGLLIVLLLAVIAGLVVYATLEPPETLRVGPAPAPVDPALPVRQP